MDAILNKRINIPCQNDILFLKKEWKYHYTKRFRYEFLKDKCLLLKLSNFRFFCLGKEIQTFKYT